MNTIRKFLYTALLAVGAINFLPSAAVAQEPAHGGFKLAPDVYWANATVPAGEYEFSYDPYQSSPVLTLTKLSGARAAFMLMVSNTDESKGSDSNRLLLETTAEGTYVSSMQLADCGMTLHFQAPAHPLKQMAKNATAVSASDR